MHWLSDSSSHRLLTSDSRAIHQCMTEPLVTYWLTNPLPIHLFVIGSLIRYWRTDSLIIDWLKHCWPTDSSLFLESRLTYWPASDSLIRFGLTYPLSTHWPTPDWINNYYAAHSIPIHQPYRRIQCWRIGWCLTHRFAPGSLPISRITGPSTQYWFIDPLLTHWPIVEWV